MSSYQIAKVVDSRLEASNDVTYVVEEGPAYASYFTTTSSSHSLQTTSFALNNIATRVCRDSRIVLDMRVYWDLVVSNPTGASIAVITADNFGKKQYPLARSMASLMHTVGSASVTINPSQYIDALAKLNSFPIDANFYENTQPDLVDSYANATGSTLNPLAPYSNTIAGDGVYKGRSCSWTVTNNIVPANTANQAVRITCDFWEPLVSPFCNMSKKLMKGLYGINGEQIAITWTPNIQNNLFAFIKPAGLVLNSNVVSFTPTSALRCIYLTPYQSYFNHIPNESSYQCPMYNTYNVDIGPVAAGETKSSIPSAVASFSGIPTKILVYARLSSQYVDYTTPDKYLAINSIKCEFDSGNPTMSAATPRQLYDVSTRNGLCMPSQCFLQQQLNTAITSASINGLKLFGCGPIVCFDPCIDLSLYPGNASGSVGKYIFNVTVDLQNKTLTDFPGVTLCILAISAGKLTRVGTEYNFSQLSLPQNVVEEAKDLVGIGHQAYIDGKFSNAFLGAGVGDWLKKASNILKHSLHWGMKNKDKVVRAYDVGKQAYDIGKSFLDEEMPKKKSSKKGGAELIYNRDFVPRKNMDLFYE